MSDVVQTLSQRLEALQKRLQEIETERAAIKPEIEMLKRQLAVAAPPSPGTSNRSQVLWLLRRDTDHDYSPLDMWRLLGRKSEADLNNIRVTLCRLAREGAVLRVGHGRYRIGHAG